MPNFNEMFAKTKGAPLMYKGNTLVMYDKIPFMDGDKILITFENTNSEWKQGVSLSLFGYFNVNGEDYKDGILLWEDTSPQQQIIILKSENRKRYRSKRLPPKGILVVKNIWSYKTDVGVCIHSYLGGAAMMIEEIENGRRYRCNDGHLDENFDDIIFTIQKLSKKEL